MTNKELLELAAKSVGYVVDYDKIDSRFHIQEKEGQDPFTWKRWHPLFDDGDALRLAVKLGLCISQYKDHCEVEQRKSFRPKPTEQILNEYISIMGFSDDSCAATRRAIVNVAAEIGRNMK